MFFFKEKLLAIWCYRGFIGSMVAREFRAKYLGSLLGCIWAILNPLALILIYTLIFSKVMQAKLPGINDTMAYGLFICAGLLPWVYYVEMLNRFPALFLEQAGMLKKVSFPRITLPIIVLCSSTINFLIIFSIFLLFLLITGRFPGWAVLGYIPLLIVQQAFVVGAGIMLASVNVFFRDVGQAVNVIVQFWFWFTPIVYVPAMLPPRFASLLAFNPMTRFIEAYQGMILYGRWPVWGGFFFHTVGALCALVGGFAIFKYLSDEMVDEL